MAQRRTLTERQVGVLRWIAGGCPEGVMENDFHRISAAALRRRDLVTTKGQGASWSARITRAGRNYLDAVDGPSPPAPRQGNTSVTQQLVDDVVAAGGVMRIPFEAGREVVDLERRARLAERHNRLPPNTRFQTRRVDRAYEIRIVEVTDAAPRPTLVDVPVPESVSRFHPTARAFRDAKARHEVSQDALRRATLVVHAICTEAERRGWQAGAPQVTEDSYGRTRWSPGKHGHIQIGAATRIFLLRLREEDVRLRGVWEEEVERYRNVDPASTWWRDRTVPRGRYDANATGHLKLELLREHAGVFSGRQATWADRASWSLEERLPHLFLELEERIIALARQDEDRRVAAEEHAAERRRRAEARERERQHHLARARELLAEQSRVDQLRAHVSAWAESESIRRYCDAVERHYGDDPRAAEWVAWSRERADALDPLKEAPQLPTAPEGTSQTLQPFMPAGWSISDTGA